MYANLSDQRLPSSQEKAHYGFEKIVSRLQTEYTFEGLTQMFVGRVLPETFLPLPYLDFLNSHQCVLPHEFCSLLNFNFA